MSGRPSAAELLETPGALLTRSHLAELGLGRAAIDAVFRKLPVVVFPGSSRPMIKVADYLELVKESTYDNNRVRLTGVSAYSPALALEERPDRAAQTAPAGTRPEPARRSRSCKEP
jgi:hypothetical protein